MGTLAEHSCGLRYENPTDPGSPSKSYGHSFAEISSNTLCHLGIREAKSLTTVFLLSGILGRENAKKKGKESLPMLEVETREL